MRRFIWILILLIVSVWLGLKIAEDPGFVLFMYKHWSVTMPLWFAVLSFIIIFFLFYLLLSFISSIDTSLLRFQNWLRWRRKFKSYNKTNRGLLELIEGQWRSAEQHLIEGVRQANAPLLNYLGAAYAAEEQHAYDKRDTYLRKAHQAAPQAEIAIGLTQAQLQWHQGQLEPALATLKHLRQIAPRQERVLKLLEKLYIRLGDWQALLQLLPSLRKANLIPKDQQDHFEKQIYLELLRQSTTTQNDATSLSSIQKFWQALPRKFQKDPDLRSAYVQQLALYPSQADEIEELINKTLKKQWNSELVKLYGQLQTAQPAKQLTTAEQWLKYYPNQAVLFLTLGRLAMRNQLWGKARDYFEKSLKLAATPETYAEYGKLLEHFGELSAALQRYRDGLFLAFKQDHRKS